MKVRSAFGATGWWLIVEMAAGGAIAAVVFMALLFQTSLGNAMPDWLRISAPIGLWVVGVFFIIMHRTPDKKGVEYKVW